jgi:GT2 family glycosyltransferase
VAPEHSFEVIVVDDGSTDGTGDLVRGLESGYPLDYVHRPRDADSCRAAARNLGLEYATGELVVLLDGDEVVPPGFLDEHLRAHTLVPDAVVVGPRRTFARGEADTALLAREFTMAAFPELRGGDVRAGIFAELSENLGNLAAGWHLAFSCNASVRREHLLAVGGFDAGFRKWGFEDTELAYRLHRHGLSFVFTPYATAYHPGRHVPGAERVEGWHENFARFCAKFPEPEVAAQGILRRVFTMDGADLTWQEAFLRLEYAVRALEGRLPVDGRHTLVTVTEDNLEDVRRELLGAGPSEHVLVLDTTPDLDLPLQVQGVRTDRELLYAKQPAPEQLDRLVARYVSPR